MWHLLRSVLLGSLGGDIFAVVMRRSDALSMVVAITS